MHLLRPLRAPLPWLQHGLTHLQPELPPPCLQPRLSHRTGHRRRRAVGASSRQLHQRTLESRRRRRPLGCVQRRRLASRTRYAHRLRQQGRQSPGERGRQEQSTVGAPAPSPPPPRAWGQAPPRAAYSTAGCPPPPRAPLRLLRPPSYHRHRWRPSLRTHAAASQRTRCRRAARPRQSGGAGGLQTYPE
jgi:hypothetical protein